MQYPNAFPRISVVLSPSLGNTYFQDNSTNSFSWQEWRQTGSFKPCHKLPYVMAILIFWKLDSLLNQQMNSFLSRVMCVCPLKLKKQINNQNRLESTFRTFL